MRNLNPQEQGRINEKWKLEQGLRKMLSEKGLSAEEIEAELKKVGEGSWTPGTEIEHELRGAELETSLKVDEAGRETSVEEEVESMGGSVAETHKRELEQQREVQELAEKIRIQILTEHPEWSREQVEEELRRRTNI